MFGHIIKGIVVLLFLTFSVLSFSSLYLSPHHLFSLFISPYSLSPIFSFSHSLSYSLTLTPIIFPTLFPLSSSHSLISCSLSYLPLFFLRSLLFCLSPILSLLLSLAIYPTFSYSLSLSLLISLSYSVSHTLSPPLHTLLYFSLPLLLLSALSLPLCVSVVGFCGGDTTIRYTVHSLYSCH